MYIHIVCGIDMYCKDINLYTKTPTIILQAVIRYLLNSCFGISAILGAEGTLEVI